MAAYTDFLKRVLTWSTLLFCALTLPVMAAASKRGEQALDNIVAIVNDTVITQSELNQSIEITKKQMSADNISLPPAKALRKQILQHLINQKLQMELAEQSGIEIPEAELDKMVSHIAQENHLSVADFYKRIEQEGLSTAAYRKQMRESLLMQHLQQREVASRISVTPGEIDGYLKSVSHQESGEKEYHIQDILVAFSDSPSPQEIAIAKKFADDIVAKLRHGTQLSDLAPAESQSLQDNDLSWRKLVEVPTAFTTPVTKMKANDYSNPIQTSNGFHIVHLVGLRSLASNSKPPGRQEVAQLIFQRKFEEAMQSWIARIRGQAFIVIQDKAIA